MKILVIEGNLILKDQYMGSDKAKIFVNRVWYIERKLKVNRTQNNSNLIKNRYNFKAINKVRLCARNYF